MLRLPLLHRRPTGRPCLRPFFLFLAALLIAGCSGGSDGGVVSVGAGGGGQAPPATTGTIAGRVTESDTGTPIAGALVELVGVAPRIETTAGRSTNSDAEGNYRFDNVPAGWQTLRATVPDRLLFQQEVNVAAGETAAMDIPIWPEPGQFVVFQSYASDLVEGDVDDGFSDIYLRNMETGATTKVSVLPPDKTGGNSGFPVMSDCTRYVVFESVGQLVPEDEDGAVDVYRFDRLTGAMQCLTLGQGFSKDYCESGDLSPFTSGCGRYTVYEWNIGFSEGKVILMYDAATGETSMVSVGPPPVGIPNGCSKHPVVAAYGRYVAFDSKASNLVDDDDPGTNNRDVFLYDLEQRTTTKVSVGYDGSWTDGCSSWPSLSADGRYVAFQSQATNLVDPPAPDSATRIYARDLQTGQTVMVSVTSTGDPAAGGCYRPTISADGRYVAFYTNAPLVPEDTNSDNDVYIRDLEAGTTHLASVTTGGVAAGSSYDPVLSSDGRFVGFVSDSDELVPGVASPVQQVFGRDLVQLGTDLLSKAIGGGPGNNQSSIRSNI